MVGLMLEDDSSESFYGVPDHRNCVTQLAAVQFFAMNRLLQLPHALYIYIHGIVCRF